MGEEDNFIIDPMNGKISLQRKNIKKRKTQIEKIDMPLDEVEQKKRKRREESESKQVSHSEFPLFNDGGDNA